MLIEAKIKIRIFWYYYINKVLQGCVPGVVNIFNSNKDFMIYSKLIFTKDLISISHIAFVITEFIYKFFIVLIAFGFI